MGLRACAHARVCVGPACTRAVEWRAVHRDRRGGAWQWVNGACADAPGFLCATIAYEGDPDYFSYPTSTRDGTPLNVSDDAFHFELHSSAARAANASVRVRVRNVNDPPTILAPSNVTFPVSARPGENSAKVGRDVVIVDHDRGVGYYQVEVSANLGSLTELDYRQPGLGDVASADKWQWSVDAVEPTRGRRFDAA